MLRFAFTQFDMPVWPDPRLACLHRRFRAPDKDERDQDDAPHDSHALYPLGTVYENAEPPRLIVTFWLVAVIESPG